MAVKLADILFFVLLPLLLLVGMLVATFTPGNPPEGLIIGWAVWAIWVVLGVHYFYLWGRSRWK